VYVPSQVYVNGAFNAEIVGPIRGSAKE